MNIKTVVVSSLNRTGGTAEDFTITDTNTVFIQKPKSVKCVSATIPYTWYNVSAGSNVMEFTGTVSGLWSILIDSNNYTGATLATALSLAMSTAAGPEVYTVTYNMVTNKFTISSTETFSIDFTVLGNMAKILGFAEIVTPVAMSVTSSMVAGFVTEKSIWICSSLIDGIDNGFINWVGGPPPNNHVLFAFPIIGCFGSIMNACDCGVPFFPITNSDFSLVDRNTPRTVRFWLAFPDGTPVLLNGQDWELTLLFDFNQPISGY